VGLERFGLSSRAPEAQSLDQASRQPQNADSSIPSNVTEAILKTLWSNRHMKHIKKFGYELKDPELLKIRLYDLIHWFATMTYFKTRDIFYVKYVMGHRRIDNTLRYVHLAEGLVNYSDDWICKVAKNIKKHVS